MGISVAIVAVISLSAVLSVLLLAWYSVSVARRRGGKTWIELHAAGIVHFRFGTEINPSLGDRSATNQDSVETAPDAVAIEPPPAEKSSRRRRSRSKPRDNLPKEVG
ncbi:hypothetical protein GCM10025331_79180 [Actinoplanes utahensis]|nr:hypothetical protein Aut01nite_81730 [Actinoplanes utahensis]